MKTGIPRIAFTALILATVIAVFDLSMINLALPVIAADLDVPLADALWLSKANLLTCALCILPCAALGNVVGHRHMLSAGLVIIVISMLGCASSPGLMQMVAWRTLQGVGSAAIMCSTLVLIGVISPKGTLGRAMGLNAFFVALTNIAGPALTGLLLQWLSWRWLFALTLPLALLALLLARAAVPNARVANSRFDWQGGLILGLLLVTLLSSASKAIANEATWLGAGLLLALFLLRQKYCEWALLPLSIFRNIRLDSALLASCLAFVGQGAAFIIVPVLLQRVLGHDPLEAAWVFIAWPLTTAIVAPWAGRWADRANARHIAQAGLLILTIGLLSLAFVPQGATAWDVAWRMGVCGIGFGLFQSPNNQEILLNVVQAQASKAAALLCLARLAGQALGAVMVAMLLERGMSRGAAPAPVDHQVTSDILCVVAVLQILSLLVTGFTYRSAHRQARVEHG